MRLDPEETNRLILAALLAAKEELLRRVALLDTAIAAATSPPPLPRARRRRRRPAQRRPAVAAQKADEAAPPPICPGASLGSTPRRRSEDLGPINPHGPAGMQAAETTPCPPDLADLWEETTDAAEPAGDPEPAVVMEDE
jgi:hypothetical protein